MSPAQTAPEDPIIHYYAVTAVVSNNLQMRLKFNL